MEAKAHIKKLKSILNQHNINYYVYDNPIISDSEFAKSSNWAWFKIRSL